MPMHSTSKQLWRDVQVFDGLAQLDEAMNLLVEDGCIAGLWPSRSFDETLAQGAADPIAWRGQAAGAQHRVALAAIGMRRLEAHQHRPAACRGLQRLDQRCGVAAILGGEKVFPGAADQAGLVGIDEPGGGAEGEGDPPIRVELDQQIGAGEGESHEAMDVLGHGGVAS